MILTLPLHCHLLKSSDDFQLSFENACCSLAAPSRYAASLSLQAGPFARESVACPSQRAASLPTILAMNSAGVMAV